MSDGNWRTPAPGRQVPDRKVARINATAEQKRQTEAARVELAARDRQLKIEQQRAELALRRERRTAKAEERAERRTARRQARAALTARVRRLVPTVGRRVMIAGPILAPMAVAWIGQIQFAQGTLAWPLVGAIVFAASWELTTAFAGWMYHQAKGAGDHGALFRFATWLFAASAGAMNYWHALDGRPVTDPTPKAVSYGAMSLVGIGLWELYSSLVHRKALRERGVIPPARPRFGVARWLRYTRITWWAWSLTIRCGYTTTDQAWAAAVAEVARRRRVRAVRGRWWLRRRMRGRTPVNVTAVWYRQRTVAQNGLVPWTALPVVWLPTTCVAQAANSGRELAPGAPPEVAPTPATSAHELAPPVGDSNERQNATDNTDASGARTGAKKTPPRTRRGPRTGGAKNGRKSTRRSMDEWVDMAEPIFHAEMERLRRQPTGHEFAAAIQSAGLGRVSASTAKNIRSEILDRTPLPQLEEEGETQ